MTVKTCLKRARLVLANAAPDDLVRGDLYCAISTASQSGDEMHDALDLVQSVACPVRGAVHAAAMKYAATGAPADGQRTIELAKRPGAATSLFDWLDMPGRKRAEVLRVLDVAIQKA